MRTRGRVIVLSAGRSVCLPVCLSAQSQDFEQNRLVYGLYLLRMSQKLKNINLYLPHERERVSGSREKQTTSGICPLPPSLSPHSLPPSLPDYTSVALVSNPKQVNKVPSLTFTKFDINPGIPHYTITYSCSGERSLEFKSISFVEGSLGLMAISLGSLVLLAPTLNNLQIVISPRSLCSTNSLPAHVVASPGAGDLPN